MGRQFLTLLSKSLRNPSPTSRFQRSQKASPKLDMSGRTVLHARTTSKKWILAKKLTTRVEDLQPSEWFFSKLTEWQKILQEWQLKQKEFRQDPMRREAAKVRAQKEKEK